MVAFGILTYVRVCVYNLKGPREQLKYINARGEIAN